MQDSVYLENNFSQISSPKSQLVAIHGLGTYSGWYRSLGEQLFKSEIAITSIDLPGFGRSGKRGEVSSFREWIESVKFAWSQTAANNPKKLYLLGHSLGAVLCMAALKELEPKPSGIILTSPGFMAHPQSWKTFEFVLPNVIKALQDSPEKVAFPFPKEVFDSVQKGTHKLDFLTGEVKPKLLLEILKVSGPAWLNFNQLREIPLLMVLAGQEKFCLNPPSELFFNLCNSPEKTLKIFSEAPHDLFVAPEADEINAYINEWLVHQSK